MRRRLRDNGLSLAFFTIFVLALAAQSIVGWLYNNDQLLQHRQTTIPWTEFVTSSAFLVDVAENWQSEFLQFFLFIFATHLVDPARFALSGGAQPPRASRGANVA